MEVTHTKLAGLQDLAPDCVMIAEAGVNWGNSKQLTASKRAFYNILGAGSFHSSHNTHESHSRSNAGAALHSLPGGVCHWVSQRMSSRTVHHHSDHLGRFATSLLHGPRNQGLAIITAYRPIDGSNADIAVAAQHRRVLGPSSDPREECLQDLIEHIGELQRNDYSVILGIDANESISNELFPSKGLNLFLQVTGLIDPVEHLHGQCPFPTSSARQGSPIDFLFCSEDILPFVETGILGIDQGASSDHRGIVMDLDLHQMWSSSEEPQQDSRTRGFRVNNTFKSREYIYKLYEILADQNTITEVHDVFQRIKSGDFDAQEEQDRLSALDDTITAAMLKAEDDIRPKRIATSHTWSPELVLAQKKANLMFQASNWMKKHGSIEGRKLERFIEQAQLIDSSWVPNFESFESVTSETSIARKEARAATKNQKDLRKKHLERLHQEMTLLGSDEHREKCLKMIRRIETQRATHRSAKAAIKPRSPAITHVVNDGVRLTGRDMNDAFVTHNQQHFLQPPRNGASAAIPGQVRDDLRPYDDEGKITRQDEAFENYYSILDGEYDLGKVKASERPFYDNLRRRVEADEDTARDITFAELHQYMKRLPERTSSSPSGRHVGLYKAMHVCIPQEGAEDVQRILATMILQVLNSCLRMSFILPRWQLGTDIMLQKKPGNYNIENMRIIKLLECDLNFLLKIKFAKHAMHSLESKLTGSPLADNQNGFRPKRSVEQGVLCNRVSLDIAHQTETPFATMETDCRAAFDCCDPNLVVVAHLRLGIPEVLAKLMANHLSLTRFNVRAGGHTSTATYGGPGRSFGSGQGGGASTINWVVLHDVTLQSLESISPKSCVIQDPSSGEIRERNSQALADDMNLTSMNTTTRQSIPQMCSILQSIGQAVNDCIRASGGSLNLSKCSWRCSVPIKTRGNLDVSDIERDLHIIPMQGSPAVTIPRLPKSTPHRQLGVHVVPSMSPKPQLALLRRKCLTYAAHISRNSLSTHQSSVIFEHYIAPAIQFPCTPHAIPSKDIDALQNIVLKPLLSKLGIASSFARHALYAPSRCGGANLRCWSLEILGKQLSLLIPHFDDSNWLGFIFRASANFSQLEWGRRTHFLASSTDLPAQLCTKTWITMIHQNYQQHNIRLLGGWVPPLKRVGDVHIGDLPSEFNIELCLTDLQLYHQVFQHLRITTVSDMVDASGRILRESVWSCTQRCTSEFKWPDKSIIITAAHKRVWHRVLSGIVNSSTRALYTSLGAWISEPNLNFPFFITPRGLIHKQHNGVWRLHAVELPIDRPTRSSHRSFSNEFSVVEPFRGHRWYTEAYTRIEDGAIITVTANTANLYDDSPPQPPPIGADTWHDFLAFLQHTTSLHPSAFDAIVGNLPIQSDTFPLLIALLRAGVKLSASGDGSVREDLMSAGSGWLFWISLVDIPAHVELERFLEVDTFDECPIVSLLAGTTLAHGRLSSLSSYRAEGTGALVIVYLLNRLTAYLRLPSPPSVTHFCDNQGLVIQVNRLKSSVPSWWWHDVTDADILSELAFQARGLDHTFVWEKGHPERRKRREEWSPSEWGNFFADGLASEAWDRPDAMGSSSLFAPKLPHASSLTLHLQDGSIHGNIKRILPPIINAVRGRQQLARYIHYTAAQLEATDWELLQICSTSFTSTALARFHFCKAFNNQWYTEAQANKYSSSLDPTCRCCHTSVETIAHVFACPSRAPLRSKIHTSLIRILRTYRIDGSLLRALELGFKVIFSDEDSHRGSLQWRGNVEGSELQQATHQFYTDTTVSDEAKRAFTFQTFLGWEDALLGRFAIEWRALSPDKNWRKPLLLELMNWGRESWSNRCTHLFGLKKDQYRLRRHRLQQEVHVWYESPFTESLLPRNSFPSDINRVLRRHNEGIARWLDEQHNRRKEINSRNPRRTGQLSIIRFCGSTESRRQHNTSFQTRLQEARKATLPTVTETSNTNDGDRSLDGHPPGEEPPD